MRPLLAVLALLLLGACDTQSDAQPTASTSPGTSSPTSSPTQAPTGAPTPGATACAEVRSGVDAFNDGDFDATVEHFRSAVPLAEAEAAADDSEAADLLLEAVTYYAELAPDEYPESSRSSTDFARYKQITLSQCVALATGPPGAEI